MFLETLDVGVSMLAIVVFRMCQKTPQDLFLLALLRKKGMQREIIGSDMVQTEILGSEQTLKLAFGISVSQDSYPYGR